MAGLSFVTVTHVATHVSHMSRLITLVELRGFEPLTFSLRTRRATNCATAPCASRRVAKIHERIWPDPIGSPAQDVRGSGRPGDRLP